MQILTKPKKSRKNLKIAEQLEVLKQLQNNLILTIGYELWNPLSTIQVCLESIVDEPSISVESKQMIVDAAVKDIQHLHLLIQDCLAQSECKLEKTNKTRDCLKLQTSLKSILQKNLWGIINKQKIATLPYLAGGFHEKYDNEDVTLRERQIEALKHISDNFIAIVGHELRTPLCTIQVCLESLSNESGLSLEYQQNMLKIALDDINRLHQLIKDFFTLSRLKKGNIYHRLEYIQFQEILDLALLSLKVNHNSHSLPKIKVELPDNLPKIKTDGDRLVEALSKLLDNACKFTESRGEIKVKAQIIQSNLRGNFDNYWYESFLEVIISDTGRGINPINLEAIFNCFYQEEDALRRTVNGTGIGLTICHHIINSLGGKIWAESAGKEQGSSFHITIPALLHE